MLSDAEREIQAVGVFDNRLRFPNPTKPTQRRAALSDERFLEVHQHTLPAGKERIGIWKVRKTRLSSQPCLLICVQQAANCAVCPVLV
jgi:hypothetical protein